MPVYAGNPRRIVGTLRTRTFLTEYRKDPKVKLRSIMHPPFVVRDTAKIDDLLTDMRQRKRHMAIVQDENKQTLGLVTIEDILEELVGEIFDEEDVVDQNFHAQGGNKYLVNTRMQIDEMYSRMGLESAPAEIAKKPLLSFMLERLGHFPEEGEAFLYENLEITAKTSDGDRITEAVVHILDEDGLARLAAEGEEVRS
jgi:CBS domain containing-hemolysin-like protein